MERQRLPLLSAVLFAAALMASVPAAADVKKSTTSKRGQFRSPEKREERRCF